MLHYYNCTKTPCCGVHRLDDSTRSRTHHSLCLQTPWHRCVLPGISASTSTRTCRCEHTSCGLQPDASRSSARRCVSRQVFQSLVVSLVLTRLDYGCATLAGFPDCLLDKLQSVMNAAAHLVCSARKFDHVTPLLRELHWLRVRERIAFRLAVHAYRCQHGLAPPYVAADIHRVAEVDSRRRLRSASTAELLVPSTEHSTIGDRAFPVAAAAV